MKRKIKQNKESGKAKFTNLTITPNITNRGISSIDSLWGLSVKNYKLDNLEDYEDKLKKMTTIDLEKHAFEYNISPEVPREIIIEQLIRLFKMYLMKGKNKIESIQQISPELNKKLISLVNS